MCNRLGGATASLGFMFSSFAIAQLISNAWLGPLSDAVGGYLCFQFRSLLVVLLVLILLLRLRLGSHPTHQVERPDPSRVGLGLGLG